MKARCIWFTGLPCAGKTTLALALKPYIPNCMHLDGDYIRDTALGRNVGFSPEDRRNHILRMGTIAKMAVDSGVTVLCSFVSPDEQTRDDVRAMFNVGDFVEVYVDASIETCEERDVKGMYAKARAGKIPDFTGVDAPYEIPEAPEVRVNTSAYFVDTCDEGLHTLDKARIKVLNELASSYELEYMVHAPFADINIASPSNLLLDIMLERLKESIVNASLLDCEVWIFHPGLETGVSMFYPEASWSRNLESTILLSRFADDHGIKVVIENMPEPYPYVMKTMEDFERFIRDIEQDIGLVMDVGHAHINHQTEEFFMTFADRIAHIHIHDNDGKRDHHLGIGFGTVDWQIILELLDKISYDKIVVIESISNVKESLDKIRNSFCRP